MARSTAERSELMRMSRGAEAPLPTQHVHEMISAQASHGPGAVALECMAREEGKEEGRWTRVLVDYGTLLAQARLAAARLASHGVRAGVLVAVLAVKRAEYFAGAALQPPAACLAASGLSCAHDALGQRSVL